MKSFFKLVIFSSIALLSPLAIAEDACQSQKYIVLNTCTEYPKMETIMNNALICSLVSNDWTCSVEFPIKKIETIYLSYVDKTLKKETNLDRHVYIVHDAFNREDVIDQIKKNIQAQVELYGCKK